MSPATVSCSSAIPTGHQLALVTLRGVVGTVVRDVTDIDHPVTRCTLDGGSSFRFRDETNVSYIALPVDAGLGAPGSLYLVNLQTRTTSLVRSWTYGGFMSDLYNWSPDGSELTYLTSDAVEVKWHLVSSSGDRTLSILGPVPGRGGRPDDDAMVGFSADGQYVAMVETFTTGSTSPFQVRRVADGSLVYSRADGTMATWLGSGATLYFRTSAAGMDWSPSAGLSSTSPVAWMHPRASPDGDRIVFTTVDPQGNDHPSVLSATRGASPLVPGLRVGAAFIASSFAWWAGEVPCPCGLGGPQLTGLTYIYDFNSGAETASIDTAFFDSWPHVVSQT